MGKLTFDGIQSLIKNSLNKTPLNVLVQAIVVKDKNAEKISQQLSISCGNLHCVGVVPLQVKENLEAQRKPSMVSQYDLILITSCKVSSSNDKTVLVIKDMNIVKTGLKSKIGDPVLYDDCKKSGSFPKIKVENTIVPDSEEESKSPPISSGAIMRKSGIIETEIDEDDYTPISSLNSMNPDWIILAKVTAKSEMRTYPGKDGKGGKLFNFDLIDTRDGQINCTCFNSGVDKFFDLIQKGKVYRISRGSVRPANRRFTSIKNDYCIIIDDKASIELVADTGKSKFKDAAFSFTKLKEISNIGAGRTTDLLSIVYEDQGLKTIKTKNGDQKSIRTLVVIDDSKDEDENTTLAASIGIWGSTGENLSVKPGEILALKNVKTGEYKGNVQLNHFGEDPIFTKEYLKHVKEAFLLMSWYKNLNIGEIRNISEVNSTDSSSKAEHVIRTDERSVYPSCPKCNKKVIQEIGSDLWICQKCNESFEKPLYGYLLLCMVSDGISNSYIWMNLFRREAEHILGGLTANEFQTLVTSESADKDAIMDIGTNSRCKHYKMVIKVIREEYQGEMRTRYHGVKVENVSYSDENDRLISLLSNYIKFKI